MEKRPRLEYAERRRVRFWRMSKRTACFQCLVACDGASTRKLGHEEAKTY